MLLRRLASWNSFLKASERSPGCEKDLRIGRGPGADGCPVGASQSVLRPQLTWLNFSIHSSISAGGAFLWATVTRPQKSTSNFLAKVSSNSEGQRSSSWRAIFPACRMELMISGTCAKEGVVRDTCRSGAKHQGHNSEPQLPEQGSLADRGAGLYWLTDHCTLSGEMTSPWAGFAL